VIELLGPHLVESGSVVLGGDLAMIGVEPERIETFPDQYKRESTIASAFEKSGSSTTRARRSA